MRKLRILHIAGTYPPDYGGGQAVTLRDVCRISAQHGHEVRVFCAGNTDEAAYDLKTEYDGLVQVNRVNLPYFKTRDPEGWKLGIFRWMVHERKLEKLLSQLLTEWKPDIVDYHSARPLGEICLILLSRHNIPTVATLHDAWLICGRVMLLNSPTSMPCPGPTPIRCLECMYSHYDGSHKAAMIKFPWRVLKLGIYPAYRLWRRRSARRVIMGAIGRSEFMAKTHRPHIQAPVRHIALGIDLTGLSTIRPLRPRAPLRFGFVAGFQGSKGINHVLDAAVALKRRGLLFELHIWGPGQEEGEAEINTRGLQGRVLLRGTYTSDSLWNVYNEMDVAIMATTVSEPLGRVPLEAAAVGAPTIAPAVGGITESIRHNVDGLLYTFRDPQDLERQMQRVLEEPGLVQRLISNLRPVPDTRDRVTAVEEFYFEVLGIAHKNIGLPIMETSCAQS